MIPCFSLDLFWAFPMSNPFFRGFPWELPAIPPLTHRTMHLSHCHSSRSRSPDGKGFHIIWTQQEQHLQLGSHLILIPTTATPNVHEIRLWNSIHAIWGNFQEFSSQTLRLSTLFECGAEAWCLTSVFRGSLVQDANWIKYCVFQSKFILCNT